MKTAGDVGQRGAPSGAHESLRYVETSALLSALLEQDAEAKLALRAPGRRVTSMLTVAESQRAVVRAHATGRVTALQQRALLRALRTFFRRCDLVAVTEEILARAGRPFPVEPIRTLDALHVATFELLGDPPALATVITRDSRVRANAVALGFAVE